MSTPLEKGGVLAGVLILFASLLFVASLIAAPAGLIAALVLAAASSLLWLSFELPARRAWLPPLILAAVALLAVTLVELTLRPSFVLWFAPLFALLGSAAAFFVALRSRARCNLCNRRLGTQSVVFQCPRCSQHVCDATCWDFEHRRCRLCLEQRVPILPLAESWWLARTGPRAHQGRCLLCLGAAEKVDLRPCPRCRRTQCRDCWDFANAECSRCGATLPDLPPSLTMAVAQVAAQDQPFA